MTSDKIFRRLDKDTIAEIAASINANIKQGKVGIINPIEIDPSERYFRQVIENDSRYSMTLMERSDAYLKCLKDMGWEPMSHPGLIINVEKGKKGFQGEKYVEQFAKKLGKTTKTIYQTLQLQNEKPEVKMKNVIKRSN